MEKLSTAYIDCHVHSYPTLVEAGTFRPFQGISWSVLEKELREREAQTGVRHCVFYGPHHRQLLDESHKKYWNELSDTSKEYLIKRVSPMLEHHALQTIGVVSWENLNALNEFDERGKIKKRVDAIKYIADYNGIAIIDLPKIEHNPEKKGVFRNLEGAATVDELAKLPDGTRSRTFLCYNAMEPRSWRREAEEMSELTGLKLLGGSDSIGFPSSLFRAYTEADAESVRDVLENTSRITEVHKGVVPFFEEKIRRYWAAGLEEYVLGKEGRDKRVHRLLRERRKANPKI